MGTKASPCPSPEPSIRLPRVRILHLGEPICYNSETYALLNSQCGFIRLSVAERQRASFAKALQNRSWGDFHAIIRPAKDVGGEMGEWDSELVDMLPPTVRVFASATVGCDGVDVKRLGERGIIYCDAEPTVIAGPAKVAEAAEELCLRNVMAVLSGGQAISPLNTAYMGSCREEASKTWS